MEKEKKTPKRYEKWLKKNVSPQNGRHIVITGANSGIGYAAACHLASLGAALTLACRNPARATAAAEALRARFPTATVRIATLDLASLASIDGFCAEMAKRGEKIDVLLHCAGVYYPREQHTADGYPTTVGVNYVGTARLTEGLLPLMADGGRAVFTTSLVDRFGRPHAKKEKRGEGYAAYAQSKLLLSAYACRRAAEGGRIAFIATHPGITATSLLDPQKTSHNPLFSRIGHAFLFLFTHKKEKAALTAVRAACGDAENGDCIGPRGPFGISGYPRKTRYCGRVRKLAKKGLPI